MTATQLALKALRTKGYIREEFRLTADSENEHFISFFCAVDIEKVYGKGVSVGGNSIVAVVDKRRKSVHVTDFRPDGAEYFQTIGLGPASDDEDEDDGDLSNCLHTFPNGSVGSRRPMSSVLNG